MSKKSKLLVGIFIILLFTIVVEIGFYTYYHLYQRKKETESSLVTNIVSLTPKPSLIPNPSYQLPETYQLPEGQDTTPAIAPVNIRWVSLLRKKFVSSASLKLEEKGVINNISNNTTQGGINLFIKDINGGPSISILRFSDNDLKIAKVTEVVGNENHPLKFSDLKIGDKIALDMTFNMLALDDNNIIALEFIKTP